MHLLGRLCGYDTFRRTDFKTLDGTTRRASSYPDTQEATALVLQRKMVRKRFFNGLNGLNGPKSAIGLSSLELNVLW